MLWPLSCDDDNWWSIVHSWMIYYQALTVVKGRWQLTEHDSYMNDILPCSDRCHATMTTNGAWFIFEGYITMLWPVSWYDDNWWSMIHTWGIYDHALTVIMRWRQLTLHDSYLKNIYPWPDCCHDSMTTERTWFIHEWYIIILCPLSGDDDSWQSTLHTLRMNNPALSVVMWRSQLTEHVSYMNDILPCSDRCHATMTTDGAWFIHEWYITMLWPLSWDDDNWWSMIHTLGVLNHALTVVVRWWQLTEHDSYLRDIYPCSNCCQ